MRCPEPSPPHRMPARMHIVLALTAASVLLAGCAGLADRNEGRARILGATSCGVVSPCILAGVLERWIDRPPAIDPDEPVTVEISTGVVDPSVIDEGCLFAVGAGRMVVDGHIRRNSSGEAIFVADEIVSAADMTGSTCWP